MSLNEIQRRINNVDGVAVLQDWAIKLPLRFQGTLLTAVRGCDLEPKVWGADGKVLYSPGRRLVSYIRWCFMNPADLREVDAEEGSFFQSSPPDPFKPSAFGHYPLHWYTHAMHSLEIIGYHHPLYSVSIEAFDMYMEMVKNLHLCPEAKEQLWDRLTEDRIATKQIVS